MKNQRLRAVAVAAALSSVFLLTTCQQFFTTSLASVLARDSYDLSGISVGSAVDMLATALSDGDAEMAAALVAPLLAAMTDATTAAAYEEAANALVSAVVLSSGVGPAITAAISGILPSFEEGSEGPTPEQMAEALGSLATISLSPTEHEGLLLIAGNPPEGMSANDAYSAAVALVADAFVSAEVELSEIGSFDTENLPEGVDQDSIDAALLLMTYAQDLPVEEGSDSLFADLISSFGM